MQALPGRVSSVLSSFLINYFNSIDGRKLRRAPFAQDAPREKLPRWFIFVAKTTEEAQEKHVFWEFLTPFAYFCQKSLCAHVPTGTEMVTKW